jgi:hypothetical protein
MKTIRYFQLMKWSGAGNVYFEREQCFVNKEDAEKFLNGSKIDYFQEKELSMYDNYDEFLKYS